MNIKINRAILWLEKTIYFPHRKRNIGVLALCLAVGQTVSAFRPELYSQILALVWITVILVTANKTAISFYNGSLKQFLATGGDAASLLASKLYYPVIRTEIFMGAYIAVAVGIMAVAHHPPRLFLLRGLICVLAAPIVMGGSTIMSLVLKDPVKTLFNLFIIVVFNLFIVAEQMFPQVYAIEVLAVAGLAVMWFCLVRRLTGEEILSKGGRR